MVSLLCTLAFCSAGVARATANDGVTAPPIVNRVVAGYAAGVRGIIGFMRYSDVRLSAGPLNRTQRWETALVMEDGLLLRAKILRITEGGKNSSDGVIAKMQNANDTELAQGRGTFKEPFDPRFVGDYRFVGTTCEQCSPGEVAVAFKSSIADEQHASGTALIDVASARVTRMTMLPYQFPNIPKPMRIVSENVTASYGGVLPGGWLRTKAAYQLVGRYAFFSGHCDIALRFGEFHRYQTVDAALEDLVLRRG